MKDTIAEFPLSGRLPKSHVFPVECKRPAQTIEAALKVEKGINKSICKRVANNPDHDLAKEVEEQTQDKLSNQSAAVSAECLVQLRGWLQWFETFSQVRIAQQSPRVISSVAPVGRNA